MTPIEKLFLDEFESLYSGRLAPTLYHYTDARGMKSIIESGLMRAFNIQYMNDHAELRYSASVMRAHIDRAYAVEPHPLFAEVLNRIRRTPIPLDISQVFLLSFSPDGDEVGMWGLYANRKSGFSFSFSATEISTVQNSLILPCKYDPQELHGFCIRCLVGLRNIVLADDAAGTGQDPQYYADDFLRHGVWFTPVFKPQIWSDEQEWRMVITRPGTHHQHLEDGRHYINIPGPGDKFDRFPIQAICLGAECDHATATEISAAAHSAGLRVPIYHSRFGRHASIPITGGVTANPPAAAPPDS